MTDRDKLIEAMATAMVGETVMSDRVRGWNDFAQAALAAIEANGLVVVPREPTEAMVHQGGSAFDHPSLYMGGPSHTGRRKADAIYRAMLAAAPLPAAPKGEGDDRPPGA